MMRLRPSEMALVRRVRMKARMSSAWVRSIRTNFLIGSRRLLIAVAVQPSINLLAAHGAL
jgi:hypothetical protein